MLHSFHMRMYVAGGFLISLISIGGYGLYAQTQFLRATLPPGIKVETTLPPVFSIEPVLEPPPKPEVTRVPLPTEVRGLYWTAETPRTKRGDELLEYMKRSGINTVVIDVKMDNGQVVLPSTSTLQRLASEGIYRIARLPVMRNSTFARAHPEYAIKNKSGKLWTDKTGAVWLDPSRVEVSDAALDLARRAYAMGFDEIQFDYVRFASDGQLSTIAKTEAEKTQTKTEIMRGFFERVGGALKKEGIPVSFDVFGMTFLTTEDFGIGQRLEDVYPFADFISPMVYPSHYWTGFQGYDNPALYPYEVVKYSLDKGAELLEVDHFVSSTESRPKFRPWIQDFDLGAEYTAARIEAQIKASRDAGASGWLLWNARNVYEPAKYK